MNSIRRICVFCGSKPGASPLFTDAARILGGALAKQKIGLVYGGASVGLMGTIADAVLAHGGEVVGVIPHGLAAKEIAHHGLTQLHRVNSMHERKALMEQLSDAFIAMPGGFGTLEEVLEIVTWIQLGLHQKPTGLLNVSGFYEPLLQQIEQGVRWGFIPAELKPALISDSDPLHLLQRLHEHAVPPATVRWIRREET